MRGGPARTGASTHQLPRAAFLDEFLNANPLVAPAVGLMVGIAVDSRCRVPAWFAVVLFAAAGMLLRKVWKRPLGPHAALLLAAAAVGALLHDTGLRRWPANHVSRFASAEGATARLRGTIVSTPSIRSGPAGSAVAYPQMPVTRFVVSTEQIGRGSAFREAGGLVSVTVREPALELGAGDRVELIGRLNRIGPPENPGSTDWRIVHQRNGILVEMSCRRATDAKLVEHPLLSWRGWLDRLRRRARASMLDGTYTGDVPGSGLLAGMVLGQRSEIDADLNEAFVRSGTVHYLSVSGAHVGMLVGAVWGVGWIFGAGRRQCAGWAMLLATGYALLAEPSAPIVRAAVMTDLACLALLLRRPVRVADCLAASILVLLVIQPTQVFNAGFQLSYVTLLSVIFVSPRAYYAARTAWRRLRRRDDPLLAPAMQIKLAMRSPRWRYWDHAVYAVGWPLAVGLTASAVGALLSAYHFHQVQCYGWLNTILFIVPIWLVMVVGFIKTLASMVAPVLNLPLGWLLATLTDGLIAAVKVMASVPGAAFATPAVPAWLVGFGLLLVLAWTLQPVLRIAPRFVRIAALAFLVAGGWTLAPPRPQSALSMHVLSVGNGLATAIQLPDGRTVLYDVGCFPPYDLERWAVGPLLSQERFWRIDAVILSHANLDHYCGVSDLMDRRWVARVFTTPHFEHAAQAHSTSRELAARLGREPDFWQRLSRGDRLGGTGEAELEVLWPPAEEVIPGDTNDTSLVLRITYADRRILVCGDIEERAMDHLMDATDLRADVLILPHHGSVTPVTAAFIRAVDPRYCIRSTGRRETSPALAEIVAGREYLSTAEHGAVEVRLAPDGVTVRPQLSR